MEHIQVSNYRLAIEELGGDQVTKRFFESKS